MVIETERLVIRLPEDSDADDSFAIHSDPDVMRWLGGMAAQSLEEERERLGRMRAMHDERGFSMWLVEEKATADVLGFAGLFPVELKGPDIEVAYHFRKASWGRGYATEAAKACLDYGFTTAGLARIVGLVDPENTASSRVLEKCGMRPEGRAHHYEKDLLKYALER
jgi:RimJ/RimL family protein N-acetyltransferase